MAITVIINGTSYQIPEQGADPPYGDDLTDYLVALGNVAQNITGTGDILTTTFNILNNQSSAANVTGASFDTSTVRSAIMQYSLYRSTNSAELSEVGHIYLTYKSTAGTWDIAQSYGGSSGVTFSITNGGQLQYTSTNMAGTGYTGKMKFKATAFTQS